MTAMALMCDPAVIVFDETTTTLDVTTQVDVLVAIRNVVRQSGTAALYISHDLAVVVQMADRIMVLRQGALLEMASTQQIISLPATPYTRALLDARRTDKPPARPIHRNAAVKAVLAVEAVTARYGRAEVISAVSLRLDAGQTVAVVGESGSGKTSLARVVTGLLPSVSGTCRLSGTVLPPRLKDRTVDQLRRLQLIHQMPDVALNPRQRVTDIISRPLVRFLGLRRRQARERVVQLLAKLGLAPEFADRFPPQLSGGQ